MSAFAYFWLFTAYCCQIGTCICGCLWPLGSFRRAEVFHLFLVKLLVLFKVAEHAVDLLSLLHFVLLNATWRSITVLLLDLGSIWCRCTILSLSLERLVIVIEKSGLCRVQLARSLRVLDTLRAYQLLGTNCILRTAREQ